MPKLSPVRILRSPKAKRVLKKNIYTENEVPNKPRKLIYLKNRYSEEPYCFDKLSIENYLNYRIEHKLPLINPFNRQHKFTKNEVNYLLSKKIFPTPSPVKRI